jgi:hypothetical protein
VTGDCATLEAEAFVLAGGPPRALRIVTYPPLQYQLSVFTEVVMAGSGVNFAITKDGGTYNKLQRPQDYLMSTTNPPPRKSVPRASAPSPTYAGKQKHDAADSTFKNKRARPEEEDLGADDFSGWAASNKRTRRTKNGILVELPGLEGDCSSDDGIGEALAYLRDVRYVLH